ncbi:hypothetical protein ACJX0J_038326 [Zea mays]
MEFIWVQGGYSCTCSRCIKKEGKKKKMLWGPVNEGAREPGAADATTTRYTQRHKQHSNIKSLFAAASTIMFNTNFIVDALAQPSRGQAGICVFGGSLIEKKNKRI